MKKIKYFLGSLAIIAMMATVACNKDEEPETPPDQEKSYDAVVTTDIVFTSGPLTKITFPTNPTPSAEEIVIEYSDAKVHVAYDEEVYKEIFL